MQRQRPCAQKGSVLGATLCSSCLEILNNFGTKDVTLSFHRGPCKWCSWSCPGTRDMVCSWRGSPSPTLPQPHPKMLQEDGSTELGDAGHQWASPGVPILQWLTACVGVGELGCSFLSTWISATGLPFASLSVWVLITDLGQGCVCRGCRAAGPPVSAGVPHRWRDMAPPLLGAGGAGAGVGQKA